MFALIRGGVALVLFCFAFLLIRRFGKVEGRKACGWSFLLAVLAYTGLSFVPLENPFLTFDTPEAAYGYYYDHPVDLTVSGTDTALVVGISEGTEYPMILPKSDDDWKFAPAASTRKILHTMYGNIQLTIFQYKSTGEYYIQILNTSGGAVDFSDSHETELVNYSFHNDTLNKDYAVYYGYVPNMTQDYTMIINGNRITPLGS